MRRAHLRYFCPWQRPISVTIANLTLSKVQVFSNEVKRRRRNTCDNLVCGDIVSGGGVPPGETQLDMMSMAI